MKKSLTHAVSKGVVLLLLAQAGNALAGVEYKVEWDEVAERYRVYMRPDATPTPDLTLSAQVTLRVPHAVDSYKFNVADLTSSHAPGAIWSATSKVHAPLEDKTVDYISFTPNLSNSQAFGLQKDVEQEIFSFKNSGPCMGVVEIMNNSTDPFNQPEGATDNSAGTNPGNEFSSIAWPTANDFVGIYGQEAVADCRTSEVANAAPVANNDAVALDMDTSATIDVLGNDSDSNGDTLTIDLVTQGGNGTVTLLNNQIVYTPKAGFSGSDSFTYTAADGKGGEDVATVNVTVNDTNTQTTNTNPSANNDSSSVEQDSLVTINVLDNDTDADDDTLSIDSFTQGGSGSVSVSGGNIIYTPSAGFTGSDSFTYTITDGKGGSGTANVTVTVKAKDSGSGGNGGGTNNDPVANADTVSVTEGDRLTIDVLANDTDADGDNLTITSKKDGDFGLVQLIGDSSLTYTPVAGTAGTTDTFTYTITDGEGGSSTATVTVSITGNAKDPDNDGLTDAEEAALGTDPAKADSDNDGLSDGLEVGNDKGTPIDTDNDGIIDALDTDDDNDSVLTIDENSQGGTATDTDGDNVPNYLDSDDDNDGILSFFENYDGDASPANDDTDKDGKPDYLDQDDDNDGILTAGEMPDLDKNGQPDDALDTDKNGVPDYLQKAVAQPVDGQVAIPTLTQWAQILLSLLLGLVALRSFIVRGKSD